MAKTAEREHEQEQVAAISPANDPELNAILQREAADAVEPGPVPGTLICRIESYTFTRSSRKRTLGVRFRCTIVDTGDDVDADIAVGEHQFDETFYLSERALFMLNNFAKACGVSIEQDRGKMIEDCVGRNFGATYEREASSQPGTRPRVVATGFFNPND